VKQLWHDFKEFALRGVVLDLAVAVVIGAAFKAIVDSFVNDVFTPIVATLFGRPDFNGLVVNLRGCTHKVVNKTIVTTCRGTVHYGRFLTQIMNFVIVAAAVFLMIKAFQRLRAMRLLALDGAAPPDQISLLTEIRDLLKSQAGPPQA